MFIHSKHSFLRRFGCRGKSLLLFALTLIFLTALPVAAQNVYTVTNTNATGAGSLFAAISSANSHVAATPDTIKFNIPGVGPHTISLSAYPKTC